MRNNFNEFEQVLEEFGELLERLKTTILFTDFRNVVTTDRKICFMFVVNC